ncbi:MAG: asparagine synthetase B [Sphingobacteriales bacterium]|nr:MAG: asparagine synthetase B [Sphingobacteriales bacterium]
MIMKRILFGFLFMLFAVKLQASYVLIYMDEKQKNHLKAYGVAYFALQSNIEVDWLLNYRGGSFAFKYNEKLEATCRIRGVSYDLVPDVQYTTILQEIANPEVNMDAVKLEKVPKVAVYTPSNKPHHPELPWDDAVTLVLDYAEIPFDKLYDEDVLDEKLAKYDWLHLHHEDFTGQYGRFYASYRNQSWYIEQVKYEESKAKQLGFSKVSQMKLAVAKKIKQYVAGGGFMFAMCSATDSYDIALSAEGVDICDRMFDGDAPDPGAQQKLDYSNTFAFKDYKLSTNPYEYEFSDIDATQTRNVPKNMDYFTLFEFSAKWDPVPTMLTQNHTQTVKGFMGQTTAFLKKYVKSDILVMGENKAAAEVRYIHNEFGQGFWTFYGGHDPEDYQHLVGEPETDVSLYPNSPGYRLILNNVLFPAAKKKKRKT